MIDSLNKVGSQVWAIVLILVGVGSIALAVMFKEPDVRTAIFSTGNGLVLVGAAIFQHQAQDDKEKP